MDRRRFVGQGALGLASALMMGRLKADEVPAGPLAVPSEKPLRCLAFGSCNRSELDQSYWKRIAAEQPDLWVWLGDNIYADTASTAIRQKYYRELFKNPYYASFRQACPVVGTWDDHDYAWDNHDGRYELKDESKAALLEFLEVPNDHPVWGHQGVYQSYALGPKGQQTQLILLDLRYNMDRQKQQKELLGDLQWAWLEQELRASTADLLIIGSSLNVLAPTQGFGLEGWQGFGAERQRLMSLLAEIGKPTVLLSGDRHFAEIAQTRLENGLPVYEIMSSGLTHAVGVKLPHKGRIGEMVGYKNFGLVHIDWESGAPRVMLEIRSTERKESYLAIQTPFVSSRG